MSDSLKPVLLHPLKSTLFALYLGTASITVRSPSSLSAREIGSVESHWGENRRGCRLLKGAPLTKTVRINDT